MKFIITQLQPPFLCGKLPTGFKIQIKIHFQPKGSIDCTQAAHSLAAWLSGGCQGPHWGFEDLEKLLLSSTSAVFHPHFPVHTPFFYSVPAHLQQPNCSLNYLRPSLSPSLAREAWGGVWASRKDVLCIQQVWVLSTVSSLTSFHVVNRISRIKPNLHLFEFGFPFPGLEKNINAAQGRVGVFFLSSWKYNMSSNGSFEHLLIKWSLSNYISLSSHRHLSS